MTEREHIGSDAWWATVRSSPFTEAEQMLRDYKTGLLAVNKGTEGYFDAGIEIQRINSELHRLSQLTQRCTMKIAVRNLFGEEGYAQVLEEVARLEFAATEPKTRQEIHDYIVSRIGHEYFSPSLHSGRA